MSKRERFSFAQYLTQIHVLKNSYIVSTQVVNHCDVHILPPVPDTGCEERTQKIYKADIHSSLSSEYFLQIRQGRSE